MECLSGNYFQDSFGKSSRNLPCLVFFFSDSLAIYFVRVMGLGDGPSGPSGGWPWGGIQEGCLANLGCDVITVQQHVFLSTHSGAHSTSAAFHCSSESPRNLASVVSAPECGANK